MFVNLWKKERSKARVDAVGALAPNSTVFRTPRRGRVSRPTQYKSPNSGGRGTRPLRYHMARRVSSYGTRPCPPALVRGVPPVRTLVTGGVRTAVGAGLPDGLPQWPEIRFAIPRNLSLRLGKSLIIYSIPFPAEKSQRKRNLHLVQSPPPFVQKYLKSIENSI